MGDTLRRLERAAVASWPAPEQVEIDGWLWRYASGGSLRANSVSALAFTGNDPEQAIDEAERRYHARGAVARFTLTAVSEPADLEARLVARGYGHGPDHVTMLKEVAASPIGAPGVAASMAYSPEWLAVYLAGLGPERAAVAPSILAGLPQRRMFFACCRGSDVVGSGLSVADGELASVQCMATRSELRRQGYARAVLCAIEAWAAGEGVTHLYLQAELANVAAIALYQGFGFRIAGRYHVRAKSR